MASDVIAQIIEVPVQSKSDTDCNEGANHISLFRKFSENNTSSVSDLPVVLASKYQDDDERDIMLDSLLNLSKATAMSANCRLRKVSLSPIPYRDIRKNLMATLNETYFTNGKASEQNENTSEIQEIVGKKRELYEKSVNSIGTYLKNFVVSDMISIGLLSFFAAEMFENDENCLS